MNQSYDVVVIGGGPGGSEAALHAARLGGRVALIEKDQVGGTCLHRGCIPTKTLIASAHAYRTLLRAKEFGIRFEGTAAPDFPAMMERKDKVIAGLTAGLERQLRSHRVELIRGTARLIDRNTIAVLRAEKEGGEIRLTTSAVILASGSRPAGIPSLTFDGRHILSSDDILAMKDEKIPRRMMVVGGGYIGCEFASLFSALGSEVVLVEATDRLLPSVDEKMAQILTREFKKRGIGLRLGQRVESARVEKDEVQCRLSGGAEETVDRVLVAVGRSLCGAGLGLESVGLSPGVRNEIAVDERMETSVPGIFAIGDVTGGIQLAHAASAQGRVAAANALSAPGSRAAQRFAPAAIPSGIFTDPEIGTVGPSEEELQERGIEYQVDALPLRVIARSHTMGELAGEVKVIAEKGTGRLLALHVIGASAAELVHEGAVAIEKGLTLSDLAGVIHAHPTLSEGIVEAVRLLDERDLSSVAG